MVAYSMGLGRPCLGFLSPLNSIIKLTFGDHLGDCAGEILASAI